jgi:hypothetical protein
MKLFTSILFLFLTGISLAQTNTTKILSEKYKGSLSLYFYNNTLRMLNQTDDADFDALIKDIEKMKFLMIDKTTVGFNQDDWKKLIKGYQSESYEEMLTSRHEGKNFNVYMREKNGDVKGTVVLISDSTSLFVLDILGKISLDKVTALYQKIDESTDVGNKIKAFTDRGERKRSKDDDEDH